MAKILLVEDNEMNRDMLERRLVRRGYEVIVAVDGVGGIEKAKTEMPDLIIMDMGLPVMDGYEATRLLKENERTRAIPILGLSAHAMSGAAEEALNAGCDDYDTKPVEVKRLMSKMQALLQKASESRRETASGEEASAEDGGEPPHNVLIADSSAENTDVLSRRATAVGLTYEVVTNGEEALRRLNDKPFAMVLLAAALPGQDVAKVVEKIRGEDRLAQLPVLILGDDTDEVTLRCLRAGAQDHLSPPFRKEVVESRLRGCLERQSLGGQEKRRQEQLEKEQRRSDRLMKALMPDEIIEELKTTRAVRPRRVEEVAVLRCRVVNFHRFCDSSDVERAFGVLQKLTESFEELAERYELEQIQIGGDTYTLAAGLINSQPNPVSSCVRCALEMKEAFGKHSSGLSVRAGVHLGPVMAGLVARRKFHFNIWGEAVHVAAALEDYGSSPCVNVSATAWRQISDQCYGESLGRFTLSECGEMEIYRADRLRGT